MSHSPPTRSRRLTHRWLLVVPFLWQVALIPAANLDSAVAHIPVLMLWQMAGICLTTIVIGFVFLADRRAGVDQEEQAFIDATTPVSGGTP